MAGESPDRSKQRESSARRTSGSASPVPEARSEAADPRLAVARDAERSAARGGADTATRVLSTRTAQDPKNTGRATGDPEPEDEAGRGGSDSETESAAGDTGRAADTEEAEGAGSDSGTEDAADAADGAAGDAGRSGSGSDTEDTADDAGEDSSGPSEESEKSEESEESEADKESPDAKGSDGRLRDAVAAWVASADEGEKPAAAKGDAEDGREAAARTDEPTVPTEAGTDGKEAAGKAAGAPEDRSDAKDADRSAEDADNGTDDADDTDGTDRRDAKPDEAAQDAVDEAGEPEADRSATGGSTAGTEAANKPSEPSKPADPRVSSGAKAAPKAPEAEDAAPETAEETDGAEESDGAGKDDATEGKARTAGPVKDETGSAKTSKPAGATGSISTSDKSDKTDGPADDDAPAEPPVDQPTAVFKAPRPQVDQPTTMLKIGGGTKDAPKKDAPTKDVPEKEAERTSKFVALKPLDDPAAKKPVAPAEATAPVPTVGPERTTQQPLPPKPPLDLLAELTNTPPPPETPLRTAARRVKIWTPLVLLLVVVFAVVQSVRPLPAPTLELTAKDSYTFEGGKVDIPWPADGQAALDVQGIGTFGSSGEQKPVPIASVAKVMTAYVILRDHPLKSGEDGPKILIDQAAQDQSDAGQESTVDVTKGDRITEREALESILIASANNVARLLARWDAGSEKAFVQKMNDAAKDLGMKNTTYTDPSGLNNTTVSTAVDQVKLAKAAMLQPAFREVATMMSYVDYKQKKHDNWNRLVGYNNVTGIKTGTTTSALGNLVFSARKDVNGEVHRIIGAVVRQPAGGPDNTILGAALHEGDKLIRAAQGALESATILKKGDVVGYADDGLGGRTPVAVTEDVTAVGWAGLSVKLTFAGDDLPHTAEAGTKVGTLTVGDGTTSAVKVPVALQKDLAEPGFAAKLTRLG
ncbi:D-alanyl-D-alanine carboxypeptidase [Streptomyces sp. NRRL S-475]|uniref:D-alanyl-D-alanine carboxypeptidase n=1 Tax=Streptomyces sp. NRRL S-475 TaxID=1463910 RepID=UPI0004C4ED60|nr:D-alanyl-D-alanine carboxypeptidase [Streptomyces sp. NRRL S-475]